MKIFKSKADMQNYLQSLGANVSFGFVPTMGALHAGHISLITTAKSKNELVISSIFVNPTQFNDKSDFEKYPVTIDTDIAKLVDAGCDVLFLPNVVEMYPNGTENLESYDLGFIETVLDGAARPGHFQGVAQVVSRLIEAVMPHDLYLGQKDFQQCLIIKKLVELKDFQLNVNIVPTKREADGLAMSSRNMRLTESQRAQANLIYQCLISIEAQQEVKSFAVVQKECIDLLEHKGFKPDYVMLANADTLEIMHEYDTSKNMVALIAAFIGEIRLIDNLPLKK